MTGASPSMPPASPSDDPQQKRRLIMGVGVFAAGWMIALAAVPLVTASDLSTAMKATLSGVLVLAVPKLFLLIAIGIMGKPGFAYLKTLVGARIRPAQVVSPLRYRFGLILLLSMVVLSNIGPYVEGVLPGRELHPHIYAAAGDLIIIASLFILGGDFWDKIRALFVREAKVTFPAK